MILVLFRGCAAQKKNDMYWGNEEVGNDKCRYEQ